MLGRFEDFSTAVIVPADGSPPVLVLPEFDLPFYVESRCWIDDVYSYGNPWSAVGVFMGQSLETKLDTPLRRDLKALRDRLAPRQEITFMKALTKALRARGLAHARVGSDDMRLAGLLAAEGIGGNAAIRDVLQPMRRARMVKTPDEVAILTRGAEINAAALRRVIAGGHAGMVESELTHIYRRELAEAEARHLGDRGMMFGAGDGSAYSLPMGETRRLEPGEAVVLDCLGTYRGYHMDLARTAVVGTATAEQRLRHKAVVTALEAVEAAIRPGVHTQDLRKLVRSTVAGFGLRGELTSVTTHGLGLEVFEFPQADSLAEGFTLEAGMVVNTEVFYRDIELGSFHLEDSVQVTETGCRLLHDVPRNLVEFH
jgi:Xaa-Pro dipeptidase